MSNANIFIITSESGDSYRITLITLKLIKKIKKIINQ